MELELSNIFDENCGKINSYILNKAFTLLFSNDKELMTNSDYIPNIWECKWFNDILIPGYSKGYTVWKNGLFSNDLDFLNKYSEKIFNYVKNNDIIYNSNLYFKHSWNDSKENKNTYNYTDELLNIISSLYLDVVYGRYSVQIDNTTLKTFSPLFDIGINNINLSTIIYISLKDDNKELLSSDSWKKINIESDFDQYIDILLSNFFNEHINIYHNNILPNTTSAELKNLYVFNNLDGFNLSNIQNQNNILTHNQYINSDGFDIVKKFVISYDENSDISATEPIKLSKWFRLWNSGYLEHGGIIKCDSNNLLSNYLYKINFDWQYSEDNKTLSAPIYNYDRIDEEYLIEDNDNLSVLKDLTFYSETNNIYLNYSNNISELYSNKDHKDIKRDTRYTIILTPYRFNNTNLININDVSSSISSIYGVNNLIDNSNIINEVHHIYNDGFSFTDNNLGLILPNKDKYKTKYYSYYCTGFITQKLLKKYI